QFSIIGQTESMRSVFSLIERVADSMATVLIEGESGTGKELVARALHEYSIRSEGPFIQVNCGAIPENLFESELFGHEKGAFTGAIQSKPGRFELAHNGTLFLDEIGELPKDLQVKLLRALQDGQYDRVGGSVTRHAHVRLVAATNRVLADEVAEGRFREDLYYRLNVIPIHLPPLRQRMADIPLLSNHFAEQAAKKFGLTHRPLSTQSQTLLSQHDWPGNIRELENIIERAVLLVDPNTDTLELNNLVGFKQSIPDQIDPPPDKQVNLKDFIRQETARIESSHIRNALEQCDGNVTHTARLLGISRKSLQNKMRSYGLRDNAEDTEDRVEE
ncbi:MAG: sigma-54 dependent transcriptional regulator, partial [Myxococcota bacterium]|nr:sigma-54 dependent transcriptional regulator [Myxococcota bacterium]